MGSGAIQCLHLLTHLCGKRAQDMATEFPYVHFRSLDLVPVMAHAPRSNVVFEVYDFAAGLLLDDSSQDIVFMNVVAELVSSINMVCLHVVDGR